MDTKLFLGIDPSLTETGISLIDEEGNSVLLTHLHVPQQGVERLAFLKAKLCQLLDPYDIAFSAIEGAAMNAVGHLHDLGQWHGVILLYLYDRGIPCATCVPMQTKKYVSGSGKQSGKATIILDVYKYYNKEVRNDNEADAFIISNIAKDYYTIFIDQKDIPDLPKHRIEVLKKLNTSSFVKKNLII